MASIIKEKMVNKSDGEIKFYKDDKQINARWYTDKRSRTAAIKRFCQLAKNLSGEHYYVIAPKTLTS